MKKLKDLEEITVYKDGREIFIVSPEVVDVMNQFRGWDRVSKKNPCLRIKIADNFEIWLKVKYA